MRTCAIRRVRFSALLGVAPAVLLGLGLPSSSTAAAATCPSGANLNIVAHEDDDILFLNPDIAQGIQSGACERTIFVTAGDANMGQAYWQSREAGAMAAYSTMAGVANTWVSADAGIPGYPLQVLTLANQPKVSVIFMHLPDGFPNGAGGSANSYESLQKLLQASIPQIHTVDRISTYSNTDLVAILSALMTAFQPQTIRTQDYLGTYGDGDHSDHHSVAYLVLQAHASYTANHTLVAYQDYSIKSRPENVSGADYAAKASAWNAYAQLDPMPCGSPPNCGLNDYTLWLSRMYILDSQAGGQGTPSANLALAGTATASSVEASGFEAAKANDGNPATRWSSGYADNQWWQVDLGSAQYVDSVEIRWEAAYASKYMVQTSTDGVTFQSAATAAPSSPGAVSTTFTPRLARYVRILCVTRATTFGFSFWEAAVHGPATIAGNAVPVASAGAAQSVPVGASVTLDGSGSLDLDGDPFTYLWTQTAGPAVVLSSATAQKPTFTAPATAATLTFSLVVNDGKVDSVPSSTTVAVAPVNLALGGTATASSVETSGFDAAKANDGNTATRWSSAYADNQWWEVDLGSAKNVDTVVVSWEAAYASGYEVQISTDGINFQAAAAVTATSAGTLRATFSPQLARYVRILCATRATAWGFSFWEVDVYGPN